MICFIFFASHSYVIIKWLGIVWNVWFNTLPVTYVDKIDQTLPGFSTCKGIARSYCRPYNTPIEVYFSFCYAVFILQFKKSITFNIKYKLKAVSQA